MMNFPRLNRASTRLLVILSLAMVFGLGSLYLLKNPTDLHHLQTWFDAHQSLTLLWRLGILVAIFITWPWFIRARARARSWPLQHIQSAIKLRYSLVLILLVLDILFQLGS